MPKIYIVPSSLFQQGRLFSAAKYEQEKERLLARRTSLERELENIPQRLADAEAGIAKHSLEKWRIDHGREIQPMDSPEAGSPD